VYANGKIVVGNGKVMSSPHEYSDRHSSTSK